jgi:ABC-2 type transport system permease protein
MFLAYVGAALVRALLVGSAMLLVAGPMVGLPVANPLALLAMFLLTGSALAALGIIAGIVSTKFDHLAAFTNFIITPLSFLSGVFYSVHSLPEPWFTASHLNPFFYMIDGFRHGFFGHSDVSIWISLGWTAGFLVLVSTICLWMLVTGYKLRK